MKTRLLLLLLMGTLAVQAQTIEVSGLQSGVWEADTVWVMGNVEIQDSLRILPGTTVIFNDFYSITAQSGTSLMALGTENDSIVFTVTDTTGFHLFDGDKGGWNGIRLYKADKARFDYCRFQYGKAALDEDQDGGALRIFNCNDVEISNSKLFCNFSREHGGALNAEHSTVVMHDCAVTDNLAYSYIDTIYFMYGGGLRFRRCDVTLTDIDFLRNVAGQSIGGALCLDSCAVSIDRCRFEHNIGVNGGGLYLIDSHETCSITNSLFANNRSEHFGGGLAIRDSSPEMSNLTVVNNHSEGVTCGGIFFYQHSSPLVRNCIVYGNTNDAPLEKPVQMWSWTFDDYAPLFYNCLVQFGWENISNHEIITVYENCIDKDPLFADPESERYQLGEESPCIDSGLTKNDDFDRLDLDKNPRVSGGIIDMGAYEFSHVGINEKTQNKHLIHIVGNPITASSYAEIELKQDGRLSAKVFSMDGKLMISKDLGRHPSGSSRIEIGGMLEGLAKGQYLLVIGSAEKTYTAKIVL